MLTAAPPLPHCCPTAAPLLLTGAPLVHHWCSSGGQGGPGVHLAPTPTKHKGWCKPRVSQKSLKIIENVQIQNMHYYLDYSMVWEGFPCPQWIFNNFHVPPPTPHKSCCSPNNNAYFEFGHSQKSPVFERFPHPPLRLHILKPLLAKMFKLAAETT